MKSSGIGGQAVLEGVMMKNRDKYAVAVRKADGTIKIENWSCKTPEQRHVLFRLPVIRGVIAFVDSLCLGIKTLTYSSSVLEEEEEEVKDAGKEALFTFLTVALALLLAVGLFMILPFFLSELLRKQIDNTTLLALIEGAIRLALFIGYVAAISQMKDIRRTFMYHGAEHKTINCVEQGLELTVENVRKQTKQHKRCGTSFMLFVMIISILFFIIIHVKNIWLRMLYRILLVPVIAGISYEFIRLAGSSDNKIIDILSKPGLWLQGITTREPDDEMIEVAIESVNAVFDWKTYQDLCRREEKRIQKRKNKKKENTQKQVADSSRKKTETKKKSKAERAADIARREAERAKRREEEAEEIRRQEETEEKLKKHLSEAQERKRKRLEKEKERKKQEEQEKSSAKEKEEETDEILEKLDRYFEYSEEEEETEKTEETEKKEEKETGTGEEAEKESAAAEDGK